jgi:hypothetical protein
MSNYHIISQSVDLKVADVVFHVPVPSGTNQAGIQWSEAIIQENGGPPASVLHGVSQAESDAIAAGTLIEIAKTVRFSSAISLDDATRLEQVKTAYTATKNETLAARQIELGPTGLGGDV